MGRRDGRPQPALTNACAARFCPVCLFVVGYECVEGHVKALTPFKERQFDDGGDAHHFRSGFPEQIDGGLAVPPVANRSSSTTTR